MSGRKLLASIFRHDIGAGRNETDMVSARTTVYGKTFDSICYTADGEAVIAGVCFLIWRLPGSLLFKL